MSYVAGDIVNFNNPLFPKKSHPHIIIAKIESDTFLVVCSTQVDEVKKRCAQVESKSTGDKLDTLVILPGGVAQSLPQDSAVNCNQCLPQNLNIIREQEESNFRARDKDNIGPHYLKLIIEAICISRLTDPIIKKLICK